MASPAGSDTSSLHHTRKMDGYAAFKHHRWPQRSSQGTRTSTASSSVWGGGRPKRTAQKPERRRRQYCNSETFTISSAYCPPATYVNSSRGSPFDINDPFDVRSTWSLPQSLMGSSATQSVLSTPRSRAETADSSQPETTITDGDSVIGGGDTDTIVSTKEPPSYEVTAPIFIETEQISLSEAQLDSSVTLFLRETPTQWLLTIPCTCVERSTPMHTEIKAKNQRYQDLCARNKVGSELQVHRDMQTINTSTKNKDVQASPPITKEAASQASEADIFDSFQSGCISFEIMYKMKRFSKGSKSTGTTNTLENAAQFHGEKTADIELLRELDQPPGTWLDIDCIDNSVESTIVRQKKEEKKIFSRPTFIDHLNLVEKMIIQNVEHEKHLMYRGKIDAIYDSEEEQAEEEEAEGEEKLDVEDSDVKENETVEEIKTEIEEEEERVQLLWSFIHPTLGVNRNISSMAWNHSNSDMVAVGFGEWDHEKHAKHTVDGIIMVWSLKNIRFPEKTMRTSRAVTSLSFSKRYPTLLAAGFYDGSIHIYDLRSRTYHIPVLSTGEGTPKHAEPVWDLEWAETGSGQHESREHLASVSTDGRVLQWSIRKGLEVQQELMRLKIVPNTAKVHGSQGDVLSLARHAGALCLAFHPSVAGTYLVGTEGGTIHKCSCSYTEQYLQTYVGHTAPVYCIRWSPFHPSVFISSGADWTVRMWDQENIHPIISIRTGSDYVTDLCWSPHLSTVFATAAGPYFQIWDLETSSLDPVLTKISPSRKPLTCVAFSATDPIIIVTDSAGATFVFRVYEPFITQIEVDENSQRLCLERLLLSAD